MEAEPVADAPATAVKATKGKGRKAKATGGVKKAKTPSSHPKYLDMVVSAVKELKERGGTSRQGIIKYIQANYDVGKDPKLVNTHLKMALKRGVSTGVLKHAKGQGASGSFKLSAATEPLPQATTKRTKAAAAKKARKPASPKAKKAVVAAAPKAKAPAAKPKKAAAAKKAKPVAAKKSPKKAASPKKAKTAKKSAKAKTPTKSAAKKAKSPKKKATPKRGKK